MSSVVEICNVALAHLGVASISSIDEASAAAGACKLQYERARDHVLSKHHWRFARGLQVLAENVTNDRTNKWTYSYASPVDLLTIRRLIPVLESATKGGFFYGPTEDGVIVEAPYEAEGGNIYCDLSPATLEYTRKITDAAAFPILVSEAIAAQLAFRVSMPLTRDRTLRADAQQIFTTAWAAATVWDANQQPNTSDHQSEMIITRN